ncbi:LacI family DNA-binding transcriptional regulator [Cellulomonas algicola]|uniref:LacI family DNA-binding transcriptional regulator n=1 Tax=Cellulomonas algicola TaxID=2071633 RepID=UPI001C3F4E75|nr:LacI family DNA-binding transcriptional regulator [Cellulomonas algicola]
MAPSRRASSPDGTARRRVTATDVAREAGVSQATVSYVLNNTPGQTIPAATRQRVQDAVARLGYAPHGAARALRTGRSDVVLFLLPDWPIGPAVVTLVEGLTERLQAQGLSLFVRRTTDGSALSGLWRTVAPAAVVSLDGLDDAEQRAMEDAGIPVVSALVRPRRSAQGVLTLSHTLIGATQLQHLAATGHRHIGYGLPDDPRVTVFRDLRLDGVRTAAFELGLAEPSARVVPMDVAGAAAAVTAWRAESPAVTAVCAYNDDQAFALLAGMRSLGLSAPADLAIIGVDDTPLAPFAHPPLTTVRQDADAVMDYLTAAVLQRLAGGTPPRPPRSEAITLVVRESA